MKLEARWLAQDKVILITMLEPPIDDDDMQQFNERLQPYFTSSSAEKVHAIIDTRRETESIKIRFIPKIDLFHEDRLGWFIIVAGTGAIQRFASQIAAQLLSLSHRQFDTVKEAVEFLAEVDSTFELGQVDMSTIS